MVFISASFLSAVSIEQSIFIASSNFRFASLSSRAPECEHYLHHILACLEVYWALSMPAVVVTDYHALLLMEL